MSDARRQSVSRGVFDEVSIQGRDIVAISPKAQYAPHLAYIALSKERCLKSGRPESNQRPPAPHVGVLPSCATAASNLVIRSEYTFHHSDHSDGNYEYTSLNLISKVLSIVSSAPPYFPLIHISHLSIYHSRHFAPQARLPRNQPQASPPHQAEVCAIHRTS